MSTGANDVFAISTIRAIPGVFRESPRPSVCCGWNNKGVAISEDKVFVGQLDGRLVALDRATGKVAWSLSRAIGGRFSITAAPCNQRPDHHGFAGGDRGAHRAGGVRTRRVFADSTIPGRQAVTRRGRRTAMCGVRRRGALQTPAVDLSSASVLLDQQRLRTQRRRPRRRQYWRRCWRSNSRQEKSLALSRCITTSGTTTRSTRRADGCKRWRAHSQSDCRGRQDRLA